MPILMFYHIKHYYRDKTIASKSVKYWKIFTMIDLFHRSIYFGNFTFFNWNLNNYITNVYSFLWFNVLFLLILINVRVHTNVISTEKYFFIIFTTKNTVHLNNKESLLRKNQLQLKHNKYSKNDAFAVLTKSESSMIIY